MSKKTRSKVTTIVIPSVSRFTNVSKKTATSRAVDAVLLNDSDDIIELSQAPARNKKSRVVKNKRGSKMGKKLTELISDYLEEDMFDDKDGLLVNIQSVKNPATKAKLKLELIKIVTPKAISEEERQALIKSNDNLNRLYFPDAVMRIEETETEEE